jgi:hypothetical protein
MLKALAFCGGFFVIDFCMELPLTSILSPEGRGKKGEGEFLIR